MDVDDYIDILRRHKAWIFGPVFAALVISVVVAFLWPDTYVSSATIRVVPPQVPENYIPTNINMDMQNRINNISQTVMSRGTLTAIINTHGLYPKERSRLPIDDVVENMRLKDIKIGSVQNQNQMTGKTSISAFQISYSYNNRFTAQRVTNDLVARFITENLRDTSQQSKSTTEFLKDQWDTAKAKLQEVEGRLQAFRSRNMGRLPDQMDSNVQQLNAMQFQMNNVNSAISRVNQEKLLLENQLRIYKEQLATAKDPGVQEQAYAQRNLKLDDKDREIASLENSLMQLREHYRETYPDVQRVEGLLAGAKRQREQLAKEDANKKPEPVVARPQNPQFVREQRDLQASIQRVGGQIEAKDLEMEQYRKEIAQFNASMKSYQSRIEGLPVGEKEYTELLRDRTLARNAFEELDQKVTKSSQATAIIDRKEGEQLELLDPASLPQTPSEPKRPVIVAIGTAIGLILGLFLVGARELKDTSLKNLKDVRAYTQLPILGSIPLLENDLVVRRRKRLGWLAWSTACLVGIVVMSSSVVYYFATKL